MATYTIQAEQREKFLWLATLDKDGKTFRGRSTVKADAILACRLKAGLRADEVRLAERAPTEVVRKEALDELLLLTPSELTAQGQVENSEGRWTASVQFYQQAFFGYGDTREEAAEACYDNALVCFSEERQGDVFGRGGFEWDALFLLAGSGAKFSQTIDGWTCSIYLDGHFVVGNGSTPKAAATACVQNAAGGRA